MAGHRRHSDSIHSCFRDVCGCPRAAVLGSLDLWLIICSVGNARDVALSVDNVWLHVKSDLSVRVVATEEYVIDVVTRCGRMCP